MGRLTPAALDDISASQIGKRQRPSLIVLQSSFTSTKQGTAKALALPLRRNDAKLSFHYIVDEGMTHRLVSDRRVARHIEDSKNSIGIQMCDDPSKPVERWDERTHSMMLARTADLVAQLCLFYGIKPRFLTDAELSKWYKWRNKRRGGIIVEGYMARGYWPSDYFLTLVRANIEKYKLVYNK